jgi:hypothetical protein
MRSKVGLCRVSYIKDENNWFCGQKRIRVSHLVPELGSNQNYRKLQGYTEACVRTLGPRDRLDAGLRTRVYNRLILSSSRTYWVRAPLFILVVRSDPAGGDCFIDYLLGQVMRQRIVMGKLHMVRAAGLGHRIQLGLIV